MISSRDDQKNASALANAARAARRYYDPIRPLDLEIAGDCFPPAEILKSLANAPERVRRREDARLAGDARRPQAIQYFVSKDGAVKDTSVEDAAAEDTTAESCDAGAGTAAKTAAKSAPTPTPATAPCEDGISCETAQSWDFGADPMLWARTRYGADVPRPSRKRRRVASWLAPSWMSTSWMSSWLPGSGAARVASGRHLRAPNPSQDLG